MIPLLWQFSPNVLLPNKFDNNHSLHSHNAVNERDLVALVCLLFPIARGWPWFLRCLNESRDIWAGSGLCWPTLLISFPRKDLQTGFHLKQQGHMKRFKRNGIRKAKAGRIPDEIGMDSTQKQALHSQYLRFIRVSLKQDRGRPMKGDFSMAVTGHGSIAGHL